MWLNLTLMISSVLLNLTAQVLIKKGMQSFGNLEFGIAQALKIIWGMVSNFYLLGALSLYGVSLGLWFVTLARVNLSIAYPFQSLGYVFAVLAGYVFFDEPFSLTKLLGIALIYGGVVVLALSGELS